MRLFAIADLHMPGGQDKPMHVFGDHWEGHLERIFGDWQKRVGPEDAVLLPGDITWAMTLDQAMDDLAAIGALPGAKVLLRGNHDYWWSSIGRIRNALPAGVYALQNDAVRLGERIIAGSRGWQTPGSKDFSPQDEKIYNREVQRLALSLRDAAKHEAPITVMMHFPPFNEKQEANGFTDLFAEYGVKRVLFGHLHGKSAEAAFRGVRDGVEYSLVSCDALDFRLCEIL